MPIMDKSFRLLDFNIYDNVIEKNLPAEVMVVRNPR